MVQIQDAMLLASLRYHTPTGQRPMVQINIGFFNGNPPEIDKMTSTFPI